MEKRVAIIGAGVSGLVACKYCLNKGFNPLVLEADERIGGVWAHTVHSTRLQNTKQAYQFSDFPWPSSVHEAFPTHYHVLDYLQSYAQHFAVFPRIRFNSKVIGIDYVGDSVEEIESWDLWSGTGQPFGSRGKWHIRVQNTKKFTIQEHEAEFIILCIGQFSGLPNIPEFGENQGPEVFKGKVMHSMEFSASNNLGTSKFAQGKRVAIIGSKKSAIDIAAECADINGIEYPCTMLQRNAHWFLPEGFLSGLLLGFLYMNRFAELLVHKPGETFLYSFLATLLLPLRWGISKFMESYVRWNIPLKKYGMVPKYSFDEDASSCQLAMLPQKFSERLKEGSIIIKKSQGFRFFKDGLIIDGESQPLQTDIVIFATGFKGNEKLINIFSSSIFQDYLKATSPLLLYRQILHPRIPQLAIIGYNESFSTLGSSEMKSLWLAHFLDSSLELPSIAHMEKEAKMWGDHIKQATGQYYKRACISNTNIWYNDQICKDLGYNPKRKNGFLTDLFVPYAPTDYADLTTK